MQDDPFVPLLWHRNLIFHLEKWASLAARPFVPARIRPNRAGPPNLVILAIDTLRRDHLGLAGNEAARTPVLDAMASSGVDFQDVTAPSPWTLPSFSSALTARMPTLHQAHLGGPVRNLDSQAPRRLTEAALTLPQHLARLGYATAAFHANPFFAFGLAETFEKQHYANLPAGHLAWLALQWIRRHADRPFFCFVLFNDPHEPTTPPQHFLQPFLARLARRGIRPTRDQLRSLIRWGHGADPSWDLGRAPLPLPPATEQARAVKLGLYDAAVAYVDSVIGRFTAQLDRWSLTDRTITSVFSDHGEEFLDHLEPARSWNHDPRQIRAIGHGHTLFQELLHVPWLTTGPGVPAGVKVPDPVSLCDVAPTLVDWLGVQPFPLPDCNLEPLRGVSVANPGPARTGTPGTPAGRVASERIVLAEEMAFGPDLVAIRHRCWKLIAGRDARPLALFNLDEDPGEKCDRKESRPEVVAKLLKTLTAWQRADPSPDKADGSWGDVSDTVRRRLRELGYSD